MSKNIELQEEFEVLLSELERLRSINEITSENSSNAKKSINEIRSFVESVNIFKRTVEDDYGSKKEMLQKTEDKLNSSLKKIDTYVSGYKKELQKLGDNHKQTASKIIEKNDTNSRDLITKYEAKLNEVKIKLENDFKSATLSYESKIENTLTKISKFKEYIETDFKTFTINYDSKIEEFSSAMENRFNDFTLSNEDKIEKSIKQIDLSFSDLKWHITNTITAESKNSEKKLLETIKEVEDAAKFRQNLFGILIGVGVIAYTVLNLVLN